MRFLVFLLTLVSFTSAQAADPLNKDRIELGIAASGIVKTVTVTTGQQVKKGQILLTLNQTAIRARLAAAGKRIAQEELELAEAEREVERNRDLYDRTLLSDHELQLAEIAYAVAHTELAEARARLAEYRIRLEQSQLRAPVNGLIREVMAWPGMAVANSMTITPLIVMSPQPDKAQ